jgi:hypothetical protein
MDAIRRYYTWRDLPELGIRYSKQHIRRLEKQGKIPPLLRRAPGCANYLTDRHIEALTGLREAASA